MATKPYKFYDRRGTNHGAGSNRLIPAATPNYDRQQVPSLQFDTHRKITSLGIAKLRDISEYLFWKYPVVQGALLEQVDLSVSSFVPQFVGEDQKWGDKATEFLSDNDDMFDVRGWPYDRESYLRNLILYTRIAGAQWTLLTESKGGFPMVQVIPAHRIGGLMENGTVAAGDPFQPPVITGEDGKPTRYSGAANPWANYRIVAGAIVNEEGTSVAYRLYDDPAVTFRDYSAQELFPAFFPMTPDQVVGIPAMAVCAWDFQDIGETRDFEKLAQKAAARITLIETNEGGEAPPGADLIAPGASGSSSPSTSSMYAERMEGGLYQYLKANTGSSISTLVANRPTENQQSYEDRLLRGCFYAIEWSSDFTLNPGTAGGAKQRVIVEKINRTCKKNQALAAKVMRRIDGYRISKAVKLGILPPNKDWWRWEYQGPAEVTADRKYESEIDLEENHRGWLTDTNALGKRGLSRRPVVKRKLEETLEKWQAASEIAKATVCPSTGKNITIQEAYDSLYKPNPNAPAPAKPEPEKPEKTGGAKTGTGTE
jgi:hypothetical protein